MARQRWASEDNNLLEQFVRQLHGMFLAVLRATKEKEEMEVVARPLPLVPAAAPMLKGMPGGPPSPIGDVPRDWKWGADFLPAVLR